MCTLTHVRTLRDAHSHTHAHGSVSRGTPRSSIISACALDLLDIYDTPLLARSTQHPGSSMGPCSPCRLFRQQQRAAEAARGGGGRGWGQRRELRVWPPCDVPPAAPGGHDTVSRRGLIKAHAMHEWTRGAGLRAAGRESWVDLPVRDLVANGVASPRLGEV